jgi:recombination protein RecT
MIVCTHSHPDHSPGAAPLQALCVQAGRAAAHSGPALGPHRARASAFTPDRALQNNELLALSGQAPEGKITHTLQVIHTPATRPTTCACCCRKTACCSAATTS